MALQAACASAGAGEPSAVFVGGEPGVGKPRLLKEIERVAVASGARCLVGGCVGVGGSELPYAPLLGALRALVRDADSQQIWGSAGLFQPCQAAAVDAVLALLLERELPGVVGADRPQEPH